MTQNMTAKPRDPEVTAGWSAAAGLLLVVSVALAWSILSSPVATDILMYGDGSGSLRVTAVIGAACWLGSFVGSILGMRGAGTGQKVLNVIFVVLLLLGSPLFLFSFVLGWN